MDVRDIRMSDYGYCLPEGRIAKFPLAERDACKLLVYGGGAVSERAFGELAGLLPAGELMVFNDTRVIQARLRFRKPTGAVVEVFLLEPSLPCDYAENFAAKGRCEWQCLVGNLKRWKSGRLTASVTAGGKEATLSAELRGGQGGTELVAFEWTGERTWAEMVEAAGELPIPPYLGREAEESDKEGYQTVYAVHEGSVAAPTAGLHFSRRTLDEIDRRGIEREQVTLHVGAGTFRPVKSETIGPHEMHAEHIAVERRTVERLISHGGRAIAVGTTSVRTLESLYHMGLRAALLMAQGADTGDAEELATEQWEPYAAPQPQATAAQALASLLAYMDKHALATLHTTTRIIIAPGYTYRIVSAMLTNFHQPGSTLLLLVAAFIGDDWRRVYDYALAHGFRFLSYGDASLLVPKPAPSDNAAELLPLTDEQGHVTGSATRGECHGGSRLLHPVVHLHVFNTAGDLFLQRRPSWKDIQPGKWDTAVGGHVDLGETIEQALRREAREELGITCFEAQRLDPYVFESDRERELVYPHICVTAQQPKPSAETDGGRFWTRDEILASLGKGLFTPNFESEYLRLPDPRQTLCPPPCRE